MTATDLQPVTVTVAEGWRIVHLDYSTFGEPTVAGALYFAVRNDAEPHNALMSAIADWHANGGVEFAQDNRYGLNIGDIYDELPAEIWARHGIRPIHIPATDLGTVEHDEVLIDGDGDLYELTIRH